jgi:hypothetical protein
MGSQDKDLTHLFVRDLDDIPLPPREKWHPTPRKESQLMTTSRYVLSAGAIAAVLVLALIASFGLRDSNPVAASPTGSPSPSQSMATPTATGSSAIVASFKLPCGTVTAYTAPSATAAGSVSLGTSTFVLLRGSGPTSGNGLSVGSSLCVIGDQDAAGAFIQFSVAPMGPGFCGVVAAHTPASATAAGSIAFATKPPVTVPVVAGVTFSAAQVSGDQCFRVVPDAQGTAQVTAYSGPRSGVAPSATPGTSMDRKSVVVNGQAVLAIDDDRIVEWFRTQSQLCDQRNLTSAPDRRMFCSDKAAFRDRTRFRSVVSSPDGMNVGFTIESDALSPDAVAGIFLRSTGSVRLLTTYYLGNEFIGFSPTGTNFVYQGNCFEARCGLFIRDSGTLAEKASLNNPTGTGRTQSANFLNWISDNEIEYRVGTELRRASF